MPWTRYRSSGTFDGHCISFGLAIWQQTQIDKHLIWQINWPEIVIIYIYSHSVLLQKVLEVTLVWRFKKNHQTAKLKSS